MTATTRIQLQITADDFDKLRGYLDACKAAATLCATDAEQKAADEAERAVRLKAEEEVEKTTASLKALKDASDAAAERARTCDINHEEWRRVRGEWLVKACVAGNHETSWINYYEDRLVTKMQTAMRAESVPDHSVAYLYACEQFFKARSSADGADLKVRTSRAKADSAKRDFEMASYRAEMEAGTRATATEIALKGVRAGAVATTRDAATRSRAEVASAYAGLPGVLRDLSHERMESLLELENWYDEDAVHNAEWGLIRAEVDPPAVPWHILAAMVRGEIPIGPFPLRSDGVRWDEKLRMCSDFMHRTLSMDVEVIWGFITKTIRHRDNYTPSYVKKVIPPKFQGHSLANLKPWPESPVPQSQQQKYIDLLRYRMDNPQEPEDSETPNKPLKNPVLYGWVMTGCKDGGTSKSTMASAYLKDVITERLGEAQDKVGVGAEVDLCVWRMRLPEWIETMEKHKNYDFGTGQRPPEPEITVATIRQAVRRFGEKMNWQPILWIEELDKIKATDTRLSWLFNLIDVIYEEKGLLITTTNLTIIELKAVLGGPRLRRLTGKQDKTAHYLVWDFHQYQPRPGAV